MAHPNRWSYMGVHLLLQAHPHSFRWVNAYSCVASWSPHHRRHPFPSCLLHNALRLCAPATLPVPMCTYPACPNVYLPCLAQCVPTLPGPMCTYPPQICLLSFSSAHHPWAFACRLYAMLAFFHSPFYLTFFSCCLLHAYLTGAFLLLLTCLPAPYLIVPWSGEPGCGRSVSGVRSRVCCAGCNGHHARC